MTVHARQRCLRSHPPRPFRGDAAQARGLRGHAPGRTAGGGSARPAGAGSEARRHHGLSRQAGFDYVVSHGGIPACLGYRGYRHTLCTSINHVVCHGIPNDKPLRDGDIVNIDVTVIVDGWHGDTSRMYLVGDVKLKARRLVDITYESHDARHRAVKPGAHHRRHRPCDPDLMPRARNAARWCAISAVTGSGASSTRCPISCIMASRATASA